MISFKLYSKIVKSQFILFFLLIFPVNAQIIPDQSLGKESSRIKLINQFNEQIEGGAIRGKNLFHSFQEFNIGEGKGTYFVNPNGVNNIFSRVTGNNVSQIFGKLGVLGNANLFLMNSKGIIFGRDASLELNNSFFATTASSILFDNKVEFNTKNIQEPLSVLIDQPIGLEFDNAGTIVVQGDGHELLELPFLTPVSRIEFIENRPRLSVKSGKSLNLLGGNIFLEGGNVVAQLGHIELGAVNQGLVSLNIDNNNDNFYLKYKEISSFGDIYLTNSALIYSGGAEKDSIIIQGKILRTRDASIILHQNLGGESSGNIRINTSESIEIIGNSPDNYNRSGIGSQILGTGTGANTIINTKNLILRDGGLLGSSTDSSGTAGDVFINVSESINLLNYTKTVPGFSSSIFLVSTNNGDAGNLFISTKELIAVEGGSIFNFTINSGEGGDIFIKADTIKLIGVVPETLSFSGIAAFTTDTGNAGKLEIDTSSLLIEDGARVSTATFDSGNAGNLIINASDWIEVKGIVSDLFSPIPIPNPIPSRIDSSANVINLETTLRQVIGLPELPIGNAGELILTTPKLQVKDGGLISVANEGLAGSGGILEINANSISIDNQGTLSGSTFSGEGGNMILFSDDFRLDNKSAITATALGTGNGGNIQIDADTLTSLNESNITANAFEGNGGNINIVSQGLFLSPDSIISASSEFGLDGTINIETEIDTTNLFDNPKINFNPQTLLIANSCLDEQRRPLQLETVLNSSTNDFTPKPMIIIKEVEFTNSSTNGWKLGDPIVEGTVLEQTPDGWRLVAAKNQELESSVCYQK